MNNTVAQCPQCGSYDLQIVEFAKPPSFMKSILLGGIFGLFKFFKNRKQQTNCWQCIRCG